MGAPPPPAPEEDLPEEEDQYLTLDTEEYLNDEEDDNPWIYDEEDTTDWMTVTIPHSVSELETLLAMMGEDCATFYPTPDVSWLRCSSLHPPSGSFAIVTGLPDSNCYMKVEYYRCDESRFPSLFTDKIWTRQYDDTVPTSVVRWVDARLHPPSLTTRQEIVVFLRSIFEEDRLPKDNNGKDAFRNRHSPWYASSDSSASTEEDADCIVLVLPRRNEKENELLSSFVVSDICPAYALYSSVEISALALQNPEYYPWLFPFGDSSSDAQLFVYRRLPPRLFLSALHPETNSPVPTKGSLWETVFTYPKLEDGEDDDSNEPSSTPSTQPKPDVTYRVVGPPYMDISELDPTLHSLQTLLQPEVRAVLQREVERIADYFIAWPEPQHYETKGAASWNVFPLCHTFPGNDISKRQWIPKTCEYVPETVALLRECFAPRDDQPQWLLRTALFSRLAPDAVLQAHTGWADLANAVIRIHIPIVLPEEEDDASLCGTWVDGCVRSHRYGELILFDDSKIHRAYNYSSTQARTVLILDVLRPAHWPPGTATGGHSPELDAFIAQFQ